MSEQKERRRKNVENEIKRDFFISCESWKHILLTRKKALMHDSINFIQKYVGMSL